MASKTQRVRCLGQVGAVSRAHSRNACPCLRNDLSSPEHPLQPSTTLCNPVKPCTTLYKPLQPSETLYNLPHGRACYRGSVKAEQDRRRVEREVTNAWLSKQYSSKAQC